MYRSPILIDAFFARPTALCAPQRVERSDQIEGTEATCGPRRPKGFVMVAQGHGEHPGAAASRSRTLGEKFEICTEINLSIYLSVCLSLPWCCGALAFGVFPFFSLVSFVI